MSAQKADTSNKVTINLINARTLYFNQTDSGAYTRFIDSVIFRQGTDMLYCDSAYQNQTTKNFQAFGDVRIVQADGTQGSCDYLRYTAAKKLAFMQGNVSLTDGKNNLRCNELTYNLGTKMAVYEDWGTLHNDSTTVTSHFGEYDVKNKKAHFRGDVIIDDPQYNIKSEDLVYYTDTKITEFFAKSIVTRDSGKSILQTSKGSYDGRNGIAHFVGWSSIWNDGQYIEADTLYYNKRTGIGFAIGHVISIDTGHHSTMFCGYAYYKQRKRFTLAAIKPVLMQVNGKDTLYMRADTFISAPMVLNKDTIRDIKPAISSDNNYMGKSKSEGAMQADSLAAMPANADTITMHTAANHEYDTAYYSLVPYAGPFPPADTDKTDRYIRRFVGSDAGVHTTAKNTLQKPERADDKEKGTLTNSPDIKTQLQYPDIRKDNKWAMPGKEEPKQKTTAVKRGKKEPAIESKAIEDTSWADTTAPLYFIGFHHVKIFSDSLQGKCDSVSYTRSDSTIRMIYKPIAWSHNSQVTGDTILLQLDSSHLRRMYVPNNAFIVSQSGPPKAQLYDQIQGKTLTAYFKNNTITHLVVFPDAECIYYPKDEKNAYLGVDQGSSVKMRVYFDDQKIRIIKFDQDPRHTMSPLEKVDIPTMRLSRFHWLIDERPKNKEELFE